MTDKTDRTPIETLYVERFGEAEADLVRQAAQVHVDQGDNPIAFTGDNKGDDDFAWALCVCASFDCWKYEDHGMAATTADVNEWAEEVRPLDDYTGEFELLSALVGAYNPFVSSLKGLDDD